MNSIIIQQILQHGNRIDYQYEIAGEWEKYFDPNIRFWVSYSQNVESIPKSIAVLPLVGNVIVMASLFDAVIYVDEIDEDFYNCVDKFIEGYQELSPKLHFKRNRLIQAQKVVLNTPQSAEDRGMLFFSGGVDAWSSLLTHLNEKPTLVSIWGADIPFDNRSGWEQVYQNVCEVSEKYDLSLITIHSTLRRFINEAQLNQFSFEAVNDNWWSAFQHSVAMMCLAAPIAACKMKNIYFASTYSAKDKRSWGSYVTASDPLIDDYVRFGGCRVVHDGYEFSRHDKVERICTYFKGAQEKPYLRVCFSSAKGDNCGKCEKCANTVMSILLAGEDPASFGFPYDQEQLPFYFASGMQEMAREEKYAFLSFYYDIWTAYREKTSADQVPDVLKAFYSTDLEVLADFLSVPCNKCEANKETQKRLQTAVDWLEQQRQAWMKKSGELENMCKEKDAWIQELQTGKDWLEQQHERLTTRVQELEMECAKKENRIRKQEAGSAQEKKHRLFFRKFMEK